jgi:pyruvate dehydrogenase E2 component (dihydrolipoamide acetyltransferase)
LAKDLGIDLAAVSPSRADGVISRADVQAAVSGAGVSSPGTAMSPDASQWGREALALESAGSTAPRSEVSGPAGGRYDPATGETRVPVKGVRKMMAAAMVSSAFTAPHVTEFLTVDVTPMMELRERLKSRREFAGLKITPLTFAARAVCIASRRTPEANAAWDGDAGEIVYRDFVNLGIAAATARGLIVPVIRGADRLSMSGLALGLAQLTDTAREGKTSPAEMTGGTITITNVGVFGVDTGTPIINPGESAIVALGSIKDAPWVVDGQLAVRKVCQLALSFDHRVMDGQQGSQFLADVGALLADPGLAMAF